MTRYSEDWNQITDLAQRKKVQNRIAQRTYRNKLKRRIAELEQLNEVLNSQTSPQQVPVEEISPYQRGLPSFVPGTSRGTRSTSREGDIGDVGNIHAGSKRGSHDQNQFSEAPPRFQDIGTSQSYTTPSPQPRPLLSPNPQIAPAGLLGAFPRSAIAAGDLLTPPPVSQSLHSTDINCMIREPQSIESNIGSYNLTLDNDSNNFFQLPDNQSTNPVTTSMDLLNLDAAISPQPNHMSQPSDGRTTLHLAVEHNRLNIVQLLLARNADIRAQDRWGYTALHVAAIRGHEELTRSLLSCYSSSSSLSYHSDSRSQHADFIDMTDATGYTALHHAAENGHSGVVEILFLAGANPRAQNNTGATLLHLAAAGGHGGHEAVVASLFLAAATSSNTRRSSRDLLKPGSNGHLPSPNKNNNDSSNRNRSNSCSSSSKQNSRAPSPHLNHTQSFHQHLNASTTSTSNHENNTSAPWSVSLHPTILHDLPHIVDNSGATPLHAAAQSGLSPRIISILLSAGAAPDVPDASTGFSPLHYAAQKGHESIVRILVDSGANAGLKARCGWNALHLAVQGGHDAVVAMLLERGAEVNGRAEE
ncbi:uncharacterized protein BP5553_03039 [Venustampulla echinocandica]|uniref:BZIP domain-containing protein n=1 Tax=Venustampulla echinocandica TaxID=2656787 RepID=A0A370TT39_9HELO|nr:uncharacterized protein BP5553_03039 [Venustampulla echinocandica]RDL38699.1 hypothetical protein BP5553_03039 [Venustampulla echinocandica]